MHAAAPPNNAQINTEIRLTPAQQQAMHDTFVQHLPAGARVFLYGSRADLNAAGGDIDLLVQVPSPVPAMLSIELIDALDQRLGEQKIDLTVTDQLQTPFIQSILPTSVVLYP